MSLSDYKFNEETNKYICPHCGKEYSKNGIGTHLVESVPLNDVAKSIAFYTARVPVYKKNSAKYSGWDILWHQEKRAKCLMLISCMPLPLLKPGKPVLEARLGPRSKVPS